MIPYIINVALILFGCLAFYKVLLRKETFYRANRFVLVLCLMISFSLPLLPVPQQWSFRKAETTIEYNQGLLPIMTEPAASVGSKTVTNVSSTQKDTVTTKASFSFDRIAIWLTWLYWFGVLVFGINFLVQLIILLYRSYRNPVIIDGLYRIVEVSGNKAPCSFGNTIFINPEKYDWDTYNQILLHEKVHIKQKHTVDIVLAEIMLIFQWFNPFAWIYRKEIENNLEFLTDDHLVQKETVEMSSYQLSLLKVSTPHLPLSLTTNYNQSLLKKRIVMMNSKRSNVHTAWKYFFLLPMLVLFAALLNNPVAYSQAANESSNENKQKKHHGIETEGYWFATIKGDQISIQFKKDEIRDNGANNGSTFPLSDFPNLPKGTNGTFRLTREAGTMEFNGKFEGDQGMGRYKFLPDQQYGSYMNSQLSDELDDEDLMVFFFINIKKDYVEQLKVAGYSKIKKDELIPLAALNVTPAYIQSIKQNGFKNVQLDKLVPLKALGIDGAYIKEIRDAGYPNISLDQLVSFKAQGIDKNYLKTVQKVQTTKGNNQANNNDKNKNDDKNKENAGNENNNINADDVVALKAMAVDEAYINSFKAVGYNNISTNELIGMKAVGVTPEFVKTFQSIGYDDIRASDLTALKSLNVTPAFINEFKAIGYNDIPLGQVISLKAMKIDANYIKAMKEKGFNYNNLQKYITLKSIEE